MGTDAVIGVKPATEYQFRIFATPVGPYFKGGVKPLTLRLSDLDRAAPRGTGHIKAGLNYAMSLYAIVDAHEKGFDENIYLDSGSRTYIEETGGANIIFVTKDNKIVTPKSDTILPELVTVKDSIDVEYVPDSISMEKPVVAPIVEDTIDSIPPVEPIEEEVIPYQVNRFTVGLRGGFASSMAKPASLPLGGDVLLDLQYAHYWSAAKNKVRLGLLAGVSAGYMNTNRNQPWDDTFSVNTSDGEIVYNVTADNIHEVNHQIQLEVPVMFSMITNSGFFFNVGPRFLLPTYTPYKQTITNGNITVTDLETGVVLNDNPVYGALSAEQENQKGKGEQQFMLTMTIGFEAGYEFKLKSGNSIGLGAFFNYGVYSMYSNNPLGSAIDVTAPDASANGVVKVESLTNAYTDKMGHLDAGVKITYNLDFIKK